MIGDVFRVQGRCPKKESQGFLMKKIAEKSGKKSEKIEIIHFMHALFSGSMSGSSAYILKMKSHLLG
jgi:hypothetical protein